MKPLPRRIAPDPGHRRATVPIPRGTHRRNRHRDGGAALVSRAVRWTAWILASAGALTGPTSAAHPGHEGALTTPQAVDRGRQAVRLLIERGDLIDGAELDPSWIDARGPASCTASALHYLVMLENQWERRRLYLLLNHSGKFLRARFDDGFAELRFSPFPMFDCER